MPATQRVSRVATATVLWASLAACNNLSTVSGNGVAKEESRELPAFVEVEVGEALTVNLGNDGLQAVKLSGDANILPLVKTEVVKNRLVISRVKPFNPVRNLHIDITMPKLQALAASGASTITATSVETPALAVNVSGASTITLKGNAPKLAVTASGASHVTARELKTDRLTLDVNGASSVAANAARELSATLAGASNASVAGSPQKVTQDVAGASHLELE